MTDPVARLARAEADAAAARGRLNLTLTVLQGRLQPKGWRAETARELTDAGEVVAHRTAAAAKANPGALAGVVAAAGLFLARHRIATLLGRRKATGGEPES